ncbi:metalloregulator ArsR/SmtB family transcription factor [Bacillus sp. NEB1478]|uniref:ArsR/SmtB family transcription factor n=1 Tax=Bacillus sp. NEB1478 TaxID=3073816 RepID=UPI002873C853|nr:metalloregulator ArsR/SmtB family transcription factor [Bacillus sp. NEB1478]WNB91512.1 metalloregulator ArsR/SmtB family transcription factor [Bacillus sp. NEB1478]
MNKEFPLLNETNTNVDFEKYEQKFKALADQQRLQIIHILATKGSVCVCDLTPLIDMPQSKLSYHLKILLDAELVNKEKRGTWNYYSLNLEGVKAILSDQLCCVFLPSCS